VEVIALCENLGQNIRPAKSTEFGGNLKLAYRGMNSLRQGGRDLFRIVRGIYAVFRYMWSKEDCQVGFGLLSAASHVARKGQSSRYVARIANAGREPLDVTLTVDIRAGTSPEPFTGHYASFTKRLTVQSRSVRTVAIEYDWMTHAVFHVDGDVLTPDSFWRGRGGMPQLYLVAASLSDPEGKRLEQLTVYQELTA
jgi:hypothetical protein